MNIKFDNLQEIDLYDYLRDSGFSEEELRQIVDVLIRKYR